MKSKSVNFKPQSDGLNKALEAILEMRETNEKIVVHHITDSATGLQLEVERQSKVFGLKFERIVING